MFSTSNLLYNQKNVICLQYLIREKNTHYIQIDFTNMNKPITTTRNDNNTYEIQIIILIKLKKLTLYCRSFRHLSLQKLDTKPWHMHLDAFLITLFHSQ